MHFWLFISLCLLSLGVCFSYPISGASRREWYVIPLRCFLSLFIFFSFLLFSFFAFIILCFCLHKVFGWKQKCLCSKEKVATLSVFRRRIGRPQSFFIFLEGRLFGWLMWSRIVWGGQTKWSLTRPGGRETVFMVQRG